MTGSDETNETDGVADEFVAEDWTMLQRLLYHDTWNEKLGRHRSPYVFHVTIPGTASVNSSGCVLFTTSSRR